MAPLSRQRTEKDTTELPTALHVVAGLVELVGADRVAGCSVHTGSIRIQPSDLREGEEIASLLGLHSALDHHMALPGFTDWSGDVRGYEVHVRGHLRERTA